MNAQQVPVRPDSAASAVPQRLAVAVLAILIVAVPLVFVPSARDSFRLPKLLLAEWLGLLSLLLLSWRRGGEGALAVVRKLVSTPAFLAVAPLVLVATLGLAVTAHPEHVRRALPALWIGAACLVGWAAGFEPAKLERLVHWGTLPAVLLGVLAILQFHGLFRPFGFAKPIEGARLGVTALAGNPGDLGAFLVLPCLVAQERIWRQHGTWRWTWAGALVLCVYALLATQTLTALAGLAVGSLALWAALLPRRQAVRLLAAGLAVAALGVAVVGPLRVRVAEKLENLVHGDWAALLTYRLDAWAVAGWMLRQHPWTGVGHGAFVTEFTPAKIALLEGGRVFPDRGTFESVFANAHNDALEVAAELGWPGLLAMVWGVATVGGVAWRRAAPERALVLAGLAAMAVVALAGFPFETAMVAYPWLLFLAWTLAPAAPVESRAVPVMATAVRRGGSRR
jgi:O-antigen ligase